ncbi:MAG TPA: hypothetical protein VME68_09520 [Acidobacteriaceae bacterium]|nr:hypothetical protein [Acidobacteriaceae bacterium]
MAKWVGKWILQIPIYLVTSYVIQVLIGSCYRLLVKAGADVPPNFLMEHFLWVALIGGFIAGVVGIVVFQAMLLLPIHFVSDYDSPWKRPQAWTWVLPSCWMVFGIIAWFGSRGHHSVLDVYGGVHGPSMLATFFGSGCSLGSDDFHAIVLGSCMKQTTFTHPWLGTLGFSAAAFFPLARFVRASPTEDARDSNHEVQVVR